MIVESPHYITHGLLTFLARVSLYELERSGGRRMSSDLEAFLGPLISGLTVHHLNAVIGALEAAGQVQTSVGPCREVAYQIDLCRDRPDDCTLAWPERELGTYYLSDVPTPRALQSDAGGQFVATAGNGPSGPPVASIDAGRAVCPSVSIVDPESDPRGPDAGPRTVEVDPSGEAVCLVSDGRLFAVADTFQDSQGVALTDAAGKHVARLAWTDDMPTLGIPQAGGGHRELQKSRE